MAAEGVGREPGPITLQLHEDPASAAPPPADEKTVVKQRVDGWASDALARQRAEVPDAYWRALEKALREGFHPDPSLLASNGYLDSWRAEAQSYGASGNPFGTGERPTLADQMRGGMQNEMRGLDSVSLAGFPQTAITLGTVMSLAEKRLRLVALVRITQQEDGTLYRTELAASSGSADYDKLAIAQARSLTRRHLGAPPQHRQTLWAFEMDREGARVHLEAVY